MRILALLLAFVLVLTSLPAMAAPAEGAAPAEAPGTAVDVAPVPAAPAEAPKPEQPLASQPTLRDMLARAPQTDFAAGDKPSSTVTLAPGQEATAEKKSHKTLWIVLGCVAGAALIWAIADSGGDDNGSGGGGGGY
jgi:hypothetical protein